MGLANISPRIASQDHADHVAGYAVAVSGLISLLAAAALASPAFAQTRQPAQITSIPSATPQQFDILDKTGTWIPFGPSAEPVDIRTFGATTASADNTAAITAAAASGKNLYFPEGTWKFASMTLDKSQRVVCAGRNKTILSQTSTTGDFITMSGNPATGGGFNSIEHCQFQPTVRVTGYQVSVTRSCFQCKIEDFWMNNHFNSILAKQGNMLTLRDGLIGSAAGTVGIRFEGDGDSLRSNNLMIYNVLINNAYPIGGPGPIVTWATSTAYVAGNAARINGIIYQQTAATCTSAASGTGPSGFPAGTTPGSIWSGRITDGTCQWGVASNSLVGLDHRNYANSVNATDFAVLNNLTAVRMVDTIGPPDSVVFDYPSFGHYDRLTGDHNFWGTFDAEGGEDVQLTNVYACSSLALNGIQTGGAFIGNLRIVGGVICYNWAHGISIAVGSNITIDGAAATSNSMRGSGLSHNIAISADISRFTITNNLIGKNAPAGSASRAAYGVFLNAGASDYYVITGNLCNGENVTGCVLDGGSGTHKTVSGNW